MHEGGGRCRPRSPPDPAWDLPHQPPVPALRPHPQAQRSFRQTVLLTIAGTPCPRTRPDRRPTPWPASFVLGLFLTAILALGIYASVDRQALLSLAVDPEVLARLGWCSSSA